MKQVQGLLGTNHKVTVIKSSIFSALTQITQNRPLEREEVIKSKG